MILVGSQAVRVHASRAITRFAEDIKIPVINTMMAKGVIPRDHKYALMTVGILQYDYANKVLEDADLIIAVGYDLVEFAPARWNKNNEKKIVHISTRPAHINKNYQCDVQVIGDVSDALNRMVDSLNAMGIGVPGAISAKLINPKKRVLTITGDGGFMMNSQELETAVRLNLNIVVLIMNDSSYGLIKWKQMDQYGETYFTDFTNPDFVKLAQAMHCVGYRIHKAEELSPILEKAFIEKVPVIIAVDYDENIKLSKKLEEWKEKEADTKTVVSY